MLHLIAVALAAEPEAPMSPGLHELFHEIDGVPYRYTVQLPELPKRGTVPVVLALHYAGHGTPHYATGFVQQLVAPGLADLGAVIIAPDCPGRTWKDELSQTVALALLDHAIETWRGDRKRVVLTGYSMGGMGTWHLAATHPERFAVALPVAGHPGDDADAMKVPIYAIHGRKDELIAWAPSEEAIALVRDHDVPAMWVLLEGRSHYETAGYVPALQDAVPWIVSHLR